MEPFRVFTGKVAALDAVNVDTDQIIPKQFLKRIERTGFGQYLFFDWRFTPNGEPDPSFALNQPEVAGASILLARRNFGSGSSREHAPWALLDYGFRVIIAPSFADIFHNNCFQNGMLPVVLPENQVDTLFEVASAEPGFLLTVDLEKQTLTKESGESWSFQVDPFRRDCLLRGLDDIGLTLEHEPAIAAYEKARGYS